MKKSIKPSLLFPFYIPVLKVLRLSEGGFVTYIQISPGLITFEIFTLFLALFSLSPFLELLS
ncbi:CLUMA_CG011665, isoform A [Clunio marinus]|uniref:CLUMA_CG011665, isoform A n=1 Tax=Clunio marinus TaxID=568069 RepID=A0A1J1IDE2_9DIPT|nr:CLUMA_CG011665, isoform A [Clunio marinus]